MIRKVKDMSFESFAIVELMGHARIAGKVSEQVIGGAAMLRVDVPETSEQSAFTKFYAPNAVYAITPVEEKIVKIAAEQFQERPVQARVLPLNTPTLVEKVVEQSDTENDEDCLPDEDWDADDCPF